MANFRTTAASAQAANDARVDRIDTGTGTATGVMKIYSGTQPADADTAIGGGNVLLAELNFSNPAFGNTDTNGMATANPISDDTNANATGTATWARCVNRDGVAQFDFDVGTSGTTAILNTTAITAGGVVSVTSCKVTQPKG